ncbi:hypothetical protein D3C81_1477300 [compost metagenome]
MDTISLRATLAWSSQTVTAIEAPIAPAMVLKKFIRPAADAISCWSTEPSAMFDSGIKKNGTAKPCKICGQASAIKSASVVQNARIKVTAPSKIRPKLASARGSCLVESFATIGDMVKLPKPMVAVK